jgi:hypothetical protein
MIGVPFGLIDLRFEAQFASTLRTDTPTHATAKVSALEHPAAFAPVGSLLAKTR